MFTWKEIIHIAMQIEQNGEQTYRHAAEKIADSRLAQDLAHLADEEARHARWLSRLTPEGSIPTGASDFEKIARTFLRESVADRPFALDQTDLRTITSQEALLETSIALEEDTILFYEMIRHFTTDDATTALFDTIITEEKAHIEKLKKCTLGKLDRIEDQVDNPHTAGE